MLGAGDEVILLGGLELAEVPFSVRGGEIREEGHMPPAKLLLRRGLVDGGEFVLPKIETRELRFSLLKSGHIDGDGGIGSNDGDPIPSSLSYTLKPLNAPNPFDKGFGKSGEILDVEDVDPLTGGKLNIVAS